jgi:virulence-associated protein VagC
LIGGASKQVHAFNTTPTTPLVRYEIKVGKKGVTVPRQMLGDAEEVEIRDENGRIIIEPVRKTEQENEDPITGLGQDPVSCGAEDASVNHDQYLSGE